MATPREQQVARALEEEWGWLCEDCGMWVATEDEATDHSDRRKHSLTACQKHRAPVAGGRVLRRGTTPREQQLAMLEYCERGEHIWTDGDACTVCGASYADQIWELNATDEQLAERPVNDKGEVVGWFGLGANR